MLNKNKKNILRENKKDIDFISKSVKDKLDKTGSILKIKK